MSLNKFSKSDLPNFEEFILDICSYSGAKKLIELKNLKCKNLKKLFINSSKFKNW